MKPARFAYYDPTSVQEVIDLLSQHGDAAKALAGGQSLVPLMNMRLARPEHVIDLNGVAELFYLEEEAGWLRLGAMTRQRQLEKSDLVAERWPLLTRATRFIGHSQIRNRGTVGGSLAHADPSAELPAVMTALDAQFVVRGTNGERTVGPDEFFVTYLTTCLEPDEILVETRVPALPSGSRPAFQEVSRRHGDFALAGAAGIIALDDAGVCQDVRIALFGVAPGPYRAREAEDLLKGEKPTETLLREVSLKAAEQLEPDSDIHASAEYRKEVGAVMVRRALMEACGITPTPVPIPERRPQADGGKP
jgi:CO/xanthine dehydrogenase FAD-binding subunit